ncbi:MAG: hypothetical protein NTY75_02090 [Candidatus Shapirobacteria bacterium]|nr:hypothetical protein [Candidatus Shapirobacteria bacterium]
MQLSELLKTTRQYFWSLGFDEVEVPYLNTSLPLEPNLYTFQTKNFYLPSSPEFVLKNHLAQSKKNCFSIAHCFRDLEAEGPLHTKEFLMLEWYEVGKTYLDLMNSVKKYVSQFIKIDFSEFKLPSGLPGNEPDFNQFFLNKIEPKLPAGGVFVTGYPAFLSPLAAMSESNIFSAHSDPKVARTAKNSLTSVKTSDRFEFYINNIEIANGCTPPCAGVGLGIDRLLSVINQPWIIESTKEDLQISSNLLTTLPLKEPKNTVRLSKTKKNLVA